MAEQWEDLFEQTLHNLITMVAGVAKIKLPMIRPIIDSVVSTLTTVNAEKAITHFVTSTYHLWNRIVKKDATVLDDISLFIPDLSETYQIMIKNVIHSLNEEQMDLVWNLLTDKIVIAVEYIKIKREKDSDYLKIVEVEKWDNLYG